MKKATTTPTKKPWTFMVYMAGDNNLDPDGVKDLKEMKRVGSTAALNVVAQFDRASGQAAKRFYIRKGGTVAADAVANLGKINTGDPKRLMDFIKWGVKEYPAERLALVLWNHGQGWDDTDIYADERHRSLRRLATGPIRHALFHAPVRRTLASATRDPRARAILLDDSAKDFLDNLEMKKVMAATRKLLKRKVDVFGMDACLMSMAEVGYQVCESADFAVGSEQTEPADGWPYTVILGELAKKPGMTARDLSALIVEKYIASYTSDAVTQSACDLSKAEALASAVAGLASALQANINDAATRQRILTVRTQVQSYEVTENIDLVDFCTLLAQSGPAAPIGQRCQEVVQAVQSAYVVAQGHKGAGMKNSHGVAIYFPTQAVSPLYAGLDLSKKTGWGVFLQAYLAAVRNR
jgi:cysteine peptidase C11 family protein